MKSPELCVDPEINHFAENEGKKKKKELLYFFLKEEGKSIG